MELWVITIDFLRLKANYDIYAQKNIPVSFPMKIGQSYRVK